MIVAELVGIIALVGLVLVLPVAALIDVSRHPDWAWARSGENKRTWTVLISLSFVLFVPIVSLAGVVSTGLYWVGRRKKVVAAQAAGQSVSPTELPAMPAGWYADPSGQMASRWWDGQVWTDHLHV